MILSCYRGGRDLVTLRDAADYIMKLAKAERISRNGKPQSLV
jgi:hypothetical protein